MPAAESEKRITLFLIVNAGGDRCQTESGRDADPRPTYWKSDLLPAQRTLPRSVELKPPNRRTRQPIERAHPAPPFVPDEPYPKPLQRIEVGWLPGNESLFGYS